MDFKREIREYIVNNILFGDDELLENDTSFQASGILDSVGFLEILHYVEENYSIEIPDSEVVPDNFDTILKISSYIETKLNEKVIA